MCPLEKLMTRKANLGFQRVPTAQPCPHKTAALPPGGKSTHNTHTRPHAASHAGRSLHRASCPQRGAHSQAAASRRRLPLCSRPWPGQRDRQAGGAQRSSDPLTPEPPRRGWPSRTRSCQWALQVTELVHLGPRKMVAPAVLSGPSEQSSPPPLPWPRPPEQTDRASSAPGHRVYAWQLSGSVCLGSGTRPGRRPSFRDPFETALTVCLLAWGPGCPNRPLPCWWEPGEHPREAQAFPRTRPSPPLLPGLAPWLESPPDLPAHFPGEVWVEGGGEGPSTLFH